jgi:hypothetical protein
MKKYPRSKATGNIGVAFVGSVVSEAGCMFRPIPQDTDVGIDGYIEFVENEIATGTLVAIQIKAGESFLRQNSDENYFSVNASKEDMNYWNNHVIPVALIAYDPVTKLSGWLDITGYIRQNPDCLKNKNTTLTIHSQTNTLTSTSLQTKFKDIFLSYRKEADLFSYADLMASLDTEKRFQGFLGLMSHPKSRFSEITCHFLFEFLFDENDKLRASVTDALSRYLDHPEVGFYPPKEIKKYVQSKITKFGRNEIVFLLETSWLDDERLMERGSLGQCAGVIILNVPDYEKHLIYIAIHDEFTEKARTAALALVYEFGIWSVIEQLLYYSDKVEWGSIGADIKMILDSYAEFMHIPFISVIENAIGNETYDEDDIAYAIRDMGTPLLVFHEYSIYKIEDKTTNPIVKFYAQQASHRIMRYKGQSTQDLLPGMEA